MRQVLFGLLAATAIVALAAPASAGDKCYSAPDNGKFPTMQVCFPLPVDVTPR